MRYWLTVILLQLELLLLAIIILPLELLACTVLYTVKMLKLFFNIPRLVAMHFGVMEVKRRAQACLAKAAEKPKEPA